MKDQKNEMPALEMNQAADILNSVFKECGRKPNSVPMEALSSYTIYRKERFELQRGILVSLLVLFFLLPFLFIDSRFTVRVEAAGERKLPVYVIEVQSRLPVHRVTANVDGQNLPVYEAGSRTFTVEPTRNGTMTVEVSLLNRQNSSMALEVRDVDHTSPVLVSSEVTDREVRLFVEDAGTGLHLNKAYGVVMSFDATAGTSGETTPAEVAGTPSETTPAEAAGTSGETTPAEAAGTPGETSADAARAQQTAAAPASEDPEAENIISPIRTDPSKGMIVFAYPSQSMDVYIPDHVGNVLHLALKVAGN